MKPTKPKILLYDIETSPLKGYAWGRYEQNLLKVIQERRMLSFSYKWLGVPGVRCHIARDLNDRHLVKRLCALIEKADLIIAHNGDKFDRRQVATRAIYHGLPPVPNTTSVDTLKVARKYFGFSGNGLSDLAEFLGLGRKYPNPGFDMWNGCMEKDPVEWARLERYNKRDVVLLERIYKAFLPWTENHPNLSRILFPKDRGELAKCNRCGSRYFMRRGYATSAKGIQRRLQCQSCGGWRTVPVKE